MNKTLQDVLDGSRDNNIKFGDLRTLLLQLGFRERIKGDHHIYKLIGVPDRINIQPVGNMAKSYQIRQIRGIILEHGLQIMLRRL